MSRLETRTLNYWQASRWLRGIGHPSWLQRAIAWQALAHLCAAPGRLGQAVEATIRAMTGRTRSGTRRDG